MSTRQPQPINYQTGFKNHFQTEAIAGTLPHMQNSPQKPAQGLYAEQISGSAFTVPRKDNLYTWFYRIQPSAAQHAFHPYHLEHWISPPFNISTPPTAMRWSPEPLPNQGLDFIHGLRSFAGHGSPHSHDGAVMLLYACNQSMQNQYFYDADGDLLIIPQEGSLWIDTECGPLSIEPGEIALIPRGIKFQVKLLSPHARGYVCENYGSPFQLPELGLIGANGLAHPRHFLTPTATFERKKGEFMLLTKFGGQFWQAQTDHSPFDVVAWHGNYAPYKYDLRLFNTINTVSFDHLDPSIFTVLTSPSHTPGVANIDFVIFPERWAVAEHTMRLPYYHRNLMSELMGLIYGCYDAKEHGFLPGGVSLHNAFTPHGPDAQGLYKAEEQVLEPQRYQSTLAFMLESRKFWELSPFALNSPQLQKDYLECWQGLKDRFTADS